MSLVFQQGSTLIVTNGDISRQLLISSIQINQTFQEEERSVKTLHSPNQVVNSFTNSKTPVSFEFSIHLTAGDGLVLEWFGFTKSGTKYTLPTVQSPIVDTNYRMYLKTMSSWYEVTKAVLTNLSFDMSKKGPLSLTVSGLGSEWKEVFVLSTPGLTTQNPQHFRLGSLSSSTFTTLAGVTLEITKDISWRNDKSIHDVLSGNLYYVKTPIMSDLSISGSITNYKRNATLGHSTFSALNFTYDDSIVFNFDSCKQLSRWEVSEVHKIITDFKAQPNSTNTYIQF